MKINCFKSIYFCDFKNSVGCFFFIKKLVKYGILNTQIGKKEVKMSLFARV